MNTKEHVILQDMHWVAILDEFPWHYNEELALFESSDTPL
jgi:hypothetical protein